MTRRAMLGLVFFAAGLAVVVFGLVLPRLQPHPFSGVVIQSPMPAPDIALTAAGGQRVSLDDFEGELVVVFFGYTNCPDICPLTLSRVDEALEEMDVDDVRVIMVSVDPERDTPDALADYLANFDDEFIGLTGTVDEVATVATTYGVFFDEGRVVGRPEYTIDHTSSLMVIGRDGHLRLVFPPDVATEQLIADLSYLRRS